MTMPRNPGRAISDAYNSLETAASLEVLSEAIRLHGVPEIVNSDQGCQYTSKLWVDTLKGLDIKISMDGKGRAKDNIWIERFWRTIKREYIYLNPCENGIELYNGIKKFMHYYNHQRHHQGIDGEIPAQRYDENKKLAEKQQVKTILKSA